MASWKVWLTCEPRARSAFSSSVYTLIVATYQLKSQKVWYRCVAENLS